MGHSRFIPLILFGLALAIRLGHLLLLQSSPLFDIPIADTQYRVQEALAVVDGSLLGSDAVYWKGPLFSYFLAGIFALAGSELFMVRIVHILIGSANIVLLFVLARRWMGASIAMLTGIMASLYGPLVYFDGEMTRIDLALRYGITSNFEIGLSLPLAVL